VAIISCQTIFRCTPEGEGGISFHKLSYTVISTSTFSRYYRDIRVLPPPHSYKSHLEDFQEEDGINGSVISNFEKFKEILEFATFEGSKKRFGNRSCFVLSIFSFENDSH